METLKVYLLSAGIIGFGFLIGVNAGIQNSLILIGVSIISLKAMNNVRGDSALGTAYVAGLLVYVVIGILIGVAYDVVYYLYKDVHFNLRDLLIPG